MIRLFLPTVQEYRIKAADRQQYVIATYIYTILLYNLLPIITFTNFKDLYHCGIVLHVLYVYIRNVIV